MFNLFVPPVISGRDHKLEISTTEIEGLSPELYSCAHWTLHQHSDNNPPDESCLNDFLNSVVLYAERKGYFVKVIGPNEEYCEGEISEHWKDMGGECGYCSGQFVTGFENS